MKKALYILTMLLLLPACSGEERKSETALPSDTMPQKPVATEKAPGPPQENKAEKIRELIEQLGHESCRLREAAEEELFYMGKAVLGQLEEAALSEDNEVKERARRLRNRIARSGKIFKEAVKSGRLEVVKKFLAAGLADLHALHLVAGAGHKDVVVFFIESGADVNLKNEIDQTPLHHAAIRGHKEIVQLLIAKGAQVDARDKYMDTPLIYALSSKQADVAEFLIASGADVNLKSSSGDTPLHRAADKGLKKIVELLIARGALVKVRTKAGNTPLVYASWREQGEIAKLLIANGVEVNTTDNGGATPLHYAADNRSGETAKILISSGADVNVKEKHFGYTPLHMAAGFGRRRSVELFIAAGADVGAKSREGYTPLHLASDKGTAQILIAKGADVNARDARGRTPLHCACNIKELVLLKGCLGLDRFTLSEERDWRKLKEAAELLIAKGADVNAKNNRGLTPLDVAKTDEIKQLLRKHGAKTGDELKKAQK